MTEDEVRERAFAMPLHNPAYPPGPYRFIDREYLTITYRCEADALSRMVPEPLELAEPKVKFEFMRMPDSTGFGDYCEAGQVIPVKYKGRDGAFSPMMFLNDEAPTAGGRELWGFPKKLGQPSLDVRKDTLVGTLDYQGIRVATGTMGYKHRELDREKVLDELTSPKFLLKIIPHVDGSARICELVEYAPVEVTIKGAWTGPGALDLVPHALAPVADLPVDSVESVVHMVTDLTLPLGEVVHDYLE